MGQPSEKTRKNAQAGRLGISGGGGGRSLACAHRCRRANEEVSVASKIWGVSSVTGGESFCCDTDSSYLKLARKHPPQRRFSSLSRCSPGPVRLAKAHSPSGKRWWVVTVLVQAGCFTKDVQSPAPSKRGGSRQRVPAQPGACSSLCEV